MSVRLIEGSISLAALLAPRGSGSMTPLACATVLLLFAALTVVATQLQAARAAHPA